MNIVYFTVSIAVSFISGVVVGVVGQRRKYRSGLAQLTSELKTSDDALESAVNKNKQSKGK
jgi:hypothetical protein